MLSFKVNLFVNLGGRKNVVTDGNVVDENALELVSLGAKNFILLESFQIVHGQVADHILALARLRLLGFFERELGHSLDGLLGGGLWVSLFELGRLTVEEFNGVGVDYAVTLTLNFKVVGNQVNRTALNERV